MGIKFASGGFLTTVQDMGRTGYQESGMSVSGVMDQRSAAIANILVGNDENEAVLEVTLMGPMMEFTEDNIIAVTGGNLVPKVNGKDLPMYQAVLVHKGDSMNFAGMTSGSRAYIAVAGGLDGRRRFRCLLLKARIRSKNLTSLELQSSTKCATPIFCRCWNYHRFRSMQKIVPRRIRSLSAAVRVPTIRSRSHHFSISSIWARARWFILT